MRSQRSVDCTESQIDMQHAPPHSQSMYQIVKKQARWCDDGEAWRIGATSRWSYRDKRLGIDSYAWIRGCPGINTRTQRTHTHKHTNTHTYTLQKKDHCECRPLTNSEASPQIMMMRGVLSDGGENRFFKASHLISPGNGTVGTTLTFRPCLSPQPNIHHVGGQSGTHSRHGSTPQRMECSA